MTPWVTNSYDRLGHLIQQATANYQMNSRYNLSGQLLSESFSGWPLDGVTVTNGYDANSRRTNLAILNASAATPASAAYGYDAAARLQTVGDGNGEVATYSPPCFAPSGQIRFSVQFPGRCPGLSCFAPSAR